MPTYRYRCAEGHEFEGEQKITDPPLQFCTVIEPVGHEQAVRCIAPVQRVPFPAPVILKGGGWAKDGYGGR